MGPSYTWLLSDKARMNAREKPPQAPHLPAKDGAKPNVIADSDLRPRYYGGADEAYEVFQVIRAWGVCFFLGCALKYIARAGKKPGSSELQDLIKARTYLNQRITKLKGEE